MELKWLQDFEALAEYRSFSKAAKIRHVTQPAFSRRIRSLENWLGVILVDREQRPMTLTDAGLAFVGEAKRLMADTEHSRERLRLNYGASRSFLFLVQHSLAVSVFPQWLESVAPLSDHKLVRVQTGNLSEILDLFLAGMGDFLLCFLSPNAVWQDMLAEADYVHIGTDCLVPVSAVSSDGVPLHRPRPGQALKVLAYPEDSFLGEIVMQEFASCMQSGISCQPVFENALADGLKVLALQRQGVAWLPFSLIREEVEKGSLAILGAPLRSIELKVALFRSRSACKPELDRFWEQASFVQYDPAGIRRPLPA